MSGRAALTDSKIREESHTGSRDQASPARRYTRSVDRPPPSGRHYVDVVRVMVVLYPDKRGWGGDM